MKTIRTALLIGACALLPTIAGAQTTQPASAPSSAMPTATPSPATTAPTTAAGQAATTSSTTSSTAATATTSAPIAAGTKVLDTAGGTAGTIESVDGDFVVLATTKSKVRLPKSSFAMGPSGPVIAMTAVQLDAAAAQAAPAASSTAAAKPNVATGAAVSDTKGGSVGTVSAVDASTATVTLTGGGKVRLPVTAFGAGSGGGLLVAMTAAQLKAAAAAK